MQTGPKVWKANGQFSGRLAPLAAAMQHYLNDERILDLTPTLALMDVQIDELLERGVLDADTPEWRSRMADTCEEIVELMLDADPKQRRRMVAKMVKLTKAMRAGVNRDRRKAAAISLAERRSVRAEAALALKIRADQNITYKQAIGLCHDVFAVVREVVTDRAIADAVITGVGRRFGQRSGVARDSSVRREGETKHNVAVRLIEERGQAGEDDGGSE